MSYYIQNQPKKLPFRSFHFFITVLGSMLLSMSAQAAGLQKAKGVLELIKTEILSIVPVIAVIALIGLGIGYAMNSIQKETFARWAVGLIIVGSAAQITSMLLT